MTPIANANFNSTQTSSIGFTAKEMLVYLQEHCDETLFRGIFTQNKIHVLIIFVLSH